MRQAGQFNADVACRIWCLASIGTLVILLLVTFPVTKTYAVPSFARQTGMPCTSCHTAFPQLTPFGRTFKLTGYTISNEQSRLPPLAVMLQGAPGFTHTRKDQADADLPARFDDNDNVSLNQISLFYAGRLFGPYARPLFGDGAARVLNKVGVFAQGTWDGVEQQWAWDNMEVRAADTISIAGGNVVMGMYVNNNPTLQDLWNTTPAWGFPFSSSGLAPAPDAAPLIAGGVSQQVIGFGGYSRIAGWLYLEAGAYTTLSADVQRSLGVDPSGETQIDHLAPYWRLTLEKTWGSHGLALGTFGLSADTFPGRDGSAGHDRFTDIGLDLQYQYLSAHHDITLMANWIHENQDLDASRQLGASANASNDLWSASFTGSYLFSKTYGIDIQYFRIEGDRDTTLYDSRTGRPDSDGWVFQLNYLPFNKGGGPAFWPYSNVKLSLQYTLYNRFNGSSRNFDGDGRDAADNNTLYLEAWIAF
jgi:hypothetical protein